MPELPEVETVRAGLEELLQLKDKAPEIRKAKILSPKLRKEIPKALAKDLKGQKLKSVRRRAKYLIFETSEGSLLNHLGMTGSWRLLKEKKKHDHFLIEFADGRELVFNDPRRFGVIDWFKKDVDQSSYFKTLGPEPLDKEFTAEYLKELTKRRSVPLKNFIMDQKVVVGVGNIYASEALFQAGLRPSRRCNKVTLKEYEILAREIKKVLKAALKAGGSTISDFKQAGGESGYFQHSFKVYGRKGQPCRKCKDPIQVQVLGGRSTFYCRKCQPR